VVETETGIETVIETETEIKTGIETKIVSIGRATVPADLTETVAEIERKLRKIGKNDERNVKNVNEKNKKKRKRKKRKGRNEKKSGKRKKKSVAKRTKRRNEKKNLYERSDDKENLAEEEEQVRFMSIDPNYGKLAQSRLRISTNWESSFTRERIIPVSISAITGQLTPNGVSRLHPKSPAHAMNSIC